MKFLDYPAQQKHKDQDFPYFYYHVTYMHPRYVMPYHWHPLYEIVHVVSGHFHLQLEEHELTLSPGDSAFISASVTHGGAPLEEKSCCYECLLMDLDTIFQTDYPTKIYEHQISDLLNQKIFVRDYFPESCTSINSSICSMLELLRHRPEGYTLLLQGYTFLLFGQIIQKRIYTSASDSKHVKKPVQLKKVLSYIDEHYSEDIKLSDLAQCANMNENYFCRYFRELTHRTPMDYLNYYRIEVACEQLSYTQKTVTEIAYDCGFHDASYFVKVFKRYRRRTPSQYMKGEF